MTTEFILLLVFYATAALMMFMGPHGPGAVLEEATPRLAAKVERDLAIGWQFTDKRTGEPATPWR